jgi:transposase InsO family protein
MHASLKKRGSPDWVGADGAGICLLSTGRVARPAAVHHRRPRPQFEGSTPGRINAACNSLYPAVRAPRDLKASTVGSARVFERAQAPELAHAQAAIQRCVSRPTTERPHRAFGYLTPQGYAEAPAARASFA